MVSYQMLFEDAGSFTLPDYTVMLARFICSILLHMQLEPEIRQGIGMLKYAYYSSEKFSSVSTPFFIAMMQITAATFTEVINMLVIC